MMHNEPLHAYRPLWAWNRVKYSNASNQTIMQIQWHHGLNWSSSSFLLLIFDTYSAIFANRSRQSPQKSRPTLFNVTILHVFWTVSSLSSAEPFQPVQGSLIDASIGRETDRQHTHNVSFMRFFFHILPPLFYYTSCSYATHLLYSMILSFYHLPALSAFALPSSAESFFLFWSLSSVPSHPLPSHLSSLQSQGWAEMIGVLFIKGAAAGTSGVNGFCLGHFNSWLLF